MELLVQIYLWDGGQNLREYLELAKRPNTFFPKKDLSMMLEIVIGLLGLVLECCLAFGLSTILMMFHHWDSPELRYGRNMNSKTMT